MLYTQAHRTEGRVQDKRAGRVDRGHLLALAFAAAATRQKFEFSFFLATKHNWLLPEALLPLPPRSRCCFLGGAARDAYSKGSVHRNTGSAAVSGKQTKGSNAQSTKQHPSLPGCQQRRGWVAGAARTCGRAVPATKGPLCCAARRPAARFEPLPRTCRAKPLAGAGGGTSQRAAQERYHAAARVVDAALLTRCFVLERPGARRAGWRPLPGARRVGELGGGVVPWRATPSPSHVEPLDEHLTGR